MPKYTMKLTIKEDWRDFMSTRSFTFHAIGEIEAIEFALIKHREWLEDLGWSVCVMIVLDPDYKLIHQSNFINGR